ncbi:hypothetical protein B0H17DRAFT_1279780, partial [Mycena rosella]
FPPRTFLAFSFFLLPFNFLSSCRHASFFPLDLHTRVFSFLPLYTYIGMFFQAIVVAACAANLVGALPVPVATISTGIPGDIPFATAFPNGFLPFSASPVGTTFAAGATPITTVITSSIQGVGTFIPTTFTRTIEPTTTSTGIPGASPFAVYGSTFTEPSFIPVQVAVSESAVATRVQTVQLGGGTFGILTKTDFTIVPVATGIPGAVTDTAAPAALTESAVTTRTDSGFGTFKFTTTVFSAIPAQSFTA